MKTCVFAVALSMLISGIYAIQNTQEITVRFLLFEGTFVQGLWEVIFFSAGSVLMWFFSLLGLLEVRSKYRRQIRERDGKIASLEEERNSMLLAFRSNNPKEQEIIAPVTDSAHVMEEKPSVYTGEERTKG